MEELPASTRATDVVARARSEAGRIIRGEDDRVLVIVGPCSIHDSDAALAYGQRLAELRRTLAGELLVVMRVYFEKPRTTVGWKGLINDPHLDASFQINQGLRLARGLLLQLAELEVPSGTEFLDTITPQFLADLVAWGAIGARTTESQVHRELASGLSMPVGFKNATDGGIQVAVDAVRAALHPHSFLSVTKQGISAIVRTHGNDSCHVILRGGGAGPNYRRPEVERAVAQLDEVGLGPRLMVDCSHANSQKDHERQIEVVREVAAQIGDGASDIFGVMMESNLVAGRQSLKPKEQLRYGQSITDACMDWDATVGLLHTLADAVRTRRGRS